jgi:hypothetical protein
VNDYENPWVKDCENPHLGRKIVALLPCLSQAITFPRTPFDGADPTGKLITSGFSSHDQIMMKEHFYVPLRMYEMQAYTNRRVQARQC